MNNSNNTLENKVEFQSSYQVTAKSLTEKLLSAAILFFTLLLFVLAMASSALANSDLDPVLEELTIAAMTDMRKGRPEEALEKLITVNGHAPMASIQYLMAECHLALNDLDAAKQLLKEASINIDSGTNQWVATNGPAPTQIHQTLGKVAFQSGKFEEARNHFSVYMQILISAEVRDESAIEWTSEAIGMCNDVAPDRLSKK